MRRMLWVFTFLSVSLAGAIMYQELAHAQAISALGSASSVADADIAPIVQGGTTKKAAMSVIKTYVLTGNAATATTAGALTTNPADCAANTYATTIAANGDLTCTTVTNAGLAGSIAASKLVAGTASSGSWDVASGGTGRATSTTAYGLLAAGTTATGVQQTLPAGATTEILVGGGASALPTWTTATGTGAPVRAGSPTLTGTITAAAANFSGNVTAANIVAAGTLTNGKACTYNSTGPVIDCNTTLSGSGTVTNTGGNLTSNAVVLGAGTVDTKVVAGITSDGATKINLGIAGTTAGGIVLSNATSGTVELRPATGALGTVTATFPAATTVIPVATQTLTFAGPTAARTITLPDAAITVARTDAANSFTGTQTLGSATPLLLGTAGSAVGDIGFRNATSGTITLAPPTGALSTVTVTLPAATDTLIGKATVDVLTNKSYDTQGTGNVFKMLDTIQLTHPHNCEGAGAIIQTTATGIDYGRGLYSGSADQAANYCEYRITVPFDLDTATEWTARIQFKLNAADTGKHRFVLSTVTQADSASATGTVATAINLDFAGDASGASGDIESVGFTTLTGWAATMTADRLLVIRLARDGDDGTNDTSTQTVTVMNLVLKYGRSQ